VAPLFTGFTELYWLQKNENGLLTLPYWVDHVGAQNTRWDRYHLEDSSNGNTPPQSSWTEIRSS